jgi:hypothetical protein
MTIKSDKWIIEQAQTNGMISPFSAEQVHFENDNKIISYSASSYSIGIKLILKGGIYEN